MSDKETIQELQRDLRSLAAQLTDQQKARALKGALRAGGRILRNEARRNVRASGVHNASALAKNILMAAPYGKTKLGMRVYLSNRARKAMHLNRRGKLKPALFWLEDGTTSRGSRQPINALGRAEQAKASEVESRLGELFDKQIEKQLKKNGWI